MTFVIGSYDHTRSLECLFRYQSKVWHQYCVTYTVCSTSSCNNAGASVMSQINEGSKSSVWLNSIQSRVHCSCPSSEQFDKPLC